MISRAAAKRCIASLLLPGLFMSSAGYASETGEISIGRRLRGHIESGALVGEESTNLIGYDAASVRFFVATGLDVMVSPQDSLMKRLESFGLEYTLAIKWEARHAVGPAVTWKLGENWRLHDMIGAVWSSNTREFDRGYQMRNDIIYKNVVSFEVVWQSLPVATRDARVGSGSVTSYYAGFALHGKWGAFLLLTATVVVVIGAVIFIYALASGLSGLN